MFLCVFWCVDYLVLLIFWCVGCIVVWIVLVWWKWRVFFCYVCYVNGGYFVIVVGYSVVWVILVDVNLCVFCGVGCGYCNGLVRCDYVVDGIGLWSVYVGYFFWMWMIDWCVGRGGEWILMI